MEDLRMELDCVGLLACDVEGCVDYVGGGCDDLASVRKG